jgi:hypothetical protein
VTPSNGIGVAGFVCGLLSVVLFWLPGLGLVLGLAGTGLSGAGMARANRTGAGKGLAIAGLVLGILGTLIGILLIIGIATSEDSSFGS